MIAPPEQLASRLGYRFADGALLAQALTHRSAGIHHNERLEFLGDALLDLVIAEALFRDCPKATEGELSRLRASLVRKDSLAQVARGLGLGPHLDLGGGELRSGGDSRDSILADALEAVVAAVYLDGGFETARGRILSLFAEPLAASTAVGEVKDPKTRLQEHLQSTRRQLPEYRVVDIGGSPHEQTFRVMCLLDDTGEATEGTGTSRRRAEQDAAARMIALLNCDD